MRALALRAGVILAAGLISGPAFACNCPKEAMLKEHGTISLFGGAKPAPAIPRKNPAASASQAPGALPKVESLPIFTPEKVRYEPDTDLLLPAAP